MISEWKNDKDISDAYLDEIKQILGLHLIGEPPVEEDQKRNTDLTVLKLNSVRVACRVRTNFYLTKNNYVNEFTIRAGRPSGVETELTKVIQGWGDYMFYGFGDKESKKLCHWHLFDLNIFRRDFVRNLYSGIKPAHIKNKDNSSSFVVFKIKDFSDEFVIAKKYHDPVLVDCARS